MLRATKSHSEPFYEEINKKPGCKRPLAPMSSPPAVHRIHSPQSRLRSKRSGKGKPVSRADTAPPLLLIEPRNCYSNVIDRSENYGLFATNLAPFPRPLLSGASWHFTGSPSRWNMLVWKSSDKMPTASTVPLAAATIQVFSS